MKILVVDDSEVALELAAQALRATGMEVVTLLSALGAAAAIAAHQPDVVLLDVTMPALSGEKAAGILKRRRTLGTVRVVLYSDLEIGELAAAAMRSGADGYIKKSADTQHLVTEVRRFAAKAT